MPPSTHASKQLNLCSRNQNSRNNEGKQKAIHSFTNGNGRWLLSLSEVIISNYAPDFVSNMVTQLLYGVLNTM